MGTLEQIKNKEGKKEQRHTQIMLLPQQNKKLAQQHFDTLPENDINKKYYNGKKYSSPSGYFSKILHYPTVPSKLNILRKFYPYQRAVTATVYDYNEEGKIYIRNSLAVTALAWFTLFQCARQGYVFPVLREYGLFFKTHRLFRHYLYAAVVPITFAYFSLNHQFFPHVETLWNIHVNRLNQQILEDPQDTIYPKELQPKRNFGFQERKDSNISHMRFVH
eukprot:TRINITY_DN554_c0_g1_i4.p1 TRINITY_DN554_c0_g1~~TRINITY_DN554_c0_g1_i4.p1  ORF type:complete len:220 (-),score=72.00 TRINITY_DN554_c0_g1_i4:149-808(-)